MINPCTKVGAQKWVRKHNLEKRVEPWEVQVQLEAHPCGNGESSIYLFWEAGSWDRNVYGAV